MCGQDVWKYVEQLTNQVLAHGKVNWPLNGMPTRPNTLQEDRRVHGGVKAKSRRSLAHIYIYIQTEVEALLKHVLNQGMSYFKGC